MNPIVVDTNVISLIFKKRTLSQTLRRSSCEPAASDLSFMTLAELRLWFLRGGWGDQKREMLDHFLDNFAVFCSGGGLCQVWADVTDQCIR
jgi:hypothetical protein